MEKGLKNVDPPQKVVEAKPRGSKLKGLLVQEIAEAARECLAEDDRCRHILQELIILEEELEYNSKEIGLSAYTVPKNWYHHDKRIWHEKRKKLQDKVNLLRDKVKEKRALLPDGYADQLRSPPEFTITIRF